MLIVLTHLLLSLFISVGVLANAKNSQDFYKRKYMNFVLAAQKPIIECRKLSWENKEAFVTIIEVPIRIKAHKE